MEDVIQVTRPFCDIEARKWMLHTLNHNCKRQWFNTSDVTYVYEDLIRAAWGECETRLVEPTDALRPLYAMVNRSKSNFNGARDVKSRFGTLLDLHVKPVLNCWGKYPDSEQGLSIVGNVTGFLQNIVLPELPLKYVASINETTCQMCVYDDDGKCENEDGEEEMVDLAKPLPWARREKLKSLPPRASSFELLTSVRGVGIPSHLDALLTSSFDVLARSSKALYSSLHDETLFKMRTATS